MNFIEITVYTQLTWHKPLYLKWESTEGTSCRIVRRKAKSPWKYYWKWSAKVVFRTKPNSAGECSVCLFQGLCKMSTPLREFSTAFVNLRNHDLSRVENSFTGWDSPQTQPGKKPHAPWASQKCFFTCQEPKHLAQDDWLQIDEVSVS